ncbi:hypothetical protein EJ08DRAFT_693580 [Tothia fuscella]|uniref:Uncharacterized protein n=1 Tax=Tothia fuscella TaxID=1048955 RepID=A0A9P4P0E0_9PEZI|nr:hypothetical protein EJ08DRAFT_693580 [Tothia fuscella]
MAKNVFRHRYAAPTGTSSDANEENEVYTGSPTTTLVARSPPRLTRDNMTRSASNTASPSSLLRFATTNISRQQQRESPGLSPPPRTQQQGSPRSGVRGPVFGSFHPPALNRRTSNDTATSRQYTVGPSDREPLRSRQNDEEDEEDGSEEDEYFDDDSTEEEDYSNDERTEEDGDAVDEAFNDAFIATESPPELHGALICPECRTNFITNFIHSLGCPVGYNHVVYDIIHSRCETCRWILPYHRMDCEHFPGNPNGGVGER